MNLNIFLFSTLIVAVAFTTSAEARSRHRSRSRSHHKSSTHLHTSRHSGSSHGSRHSSSGSEHHSFVSQHHSTADSYPKQQTHTPNPGSGVVNTHTSASHVPQQPVNTHTSASHAPQQHDYSPNSQQPNKQSSGTDDLETGYIVGTHAARRNHRHRATTAVPPTTTKDPCINMPYNNQYNEQQINCEHLGSQTIITHHYN